MHIKLLPLISIFALSYSTASAQAPNTKKNSLEFSTGYNSGYLKNLVFAPLARYEYNGLNYRLKYARTTKKEKLFEVQLDYLNSELQSDVIPALNADYSKIVLNFSALKRVYDKNRFVVHAGLQTQTNVSSYLNWREYDLQQKLGLAGRVTFQVDEKQLISSKLTLPIAMLRVSSFDNNVYSLSKYQSVLWSLEYTYSLSDYFDVKASYNFNYDRLQIPNAYRELQHQINLGIIYKF